MRSIFAKTVAQYGSTYTRQAIELVDWYIDSLYHKTTGYEHTFISRSNRMHFAKKLLDCMSEISIGFDAITDCLKQASGCI